MIKLFAMDLDGTLLNNDSKLDKKVIDSLQRLDDEGIKFVFCSGRAKPSVDYITSLTGFDNPTVANNGAIASMNKDNIIYENYLTYKDIEKLTNYCENYKLVYHFYDQKTYYSNRIRSERFKHLKKDSDYGMNYQVNFSFSENPLEELKKRGKNAFKFQIFPKKSDLITRDEILEDIKKLNKNLYITSSNDRVIEIMQKNVDKFQAICELCDYLGISKDEIATIGDGDNDIPMLKGAKMSFAVKNANDSVKDIVDYIVSSNYEFGIIEAIEKVIRFNKNV